MGDILHVNLADIVQRYSRNIMMLAFTYTSKNLVKSHWFSRRTEFPAEHGYMTERDVDLIKAVLSLDKKYRIPIHLFYYEGYSIQEVADIMNEKSTTIGTRLERGRHKLKEILGSDYYG